MSEITLEGGKWYRIVLKTSEIYEFEFIGGNPIKGKLKDRTIIDLYLLMESGYLSLIQINSLK